VLESASQLISEDAESEGARGDTHKLGSAERRITEDTESKRVSEEPLTFWIAQIDGQVRTGKGSK
jgi:hypothetical protein